MAAETPVAPPHTETGDLRSLWYLLRPEFLFLSWATMEMALLAPFFLAFMPWARLWSPVAFMLWLLLMMLIPFNLSRMLNLTGLPLSRQQNVMLLSFLGTLLVTLHAMLYREYALLSLAWLRELAAHFLQAGNPFLSRDLMLFFLLSILWWRGVSLAGRRVDINELGLRVRVGALIVAPLVIAVSQLMLGWSVIGFMLLYVFSILTAIALTRAEALELERSGRNYPMRPRWLAVVVASALVIISMAWTIAAVVSGEGLPLFLRWLKPLWTAAIAAGTVIFTTFTYITLPLMAIFERIALFINTLLGRQLNLGEPPPAEEPGDIAGQYRALIDWLANPQSNLAFVINRVVLALIILLVLLLVLLLLDRLYARRRLAAAEGEGIGSGRPLEDEDLAVEGLGRRLLRRLGLLRQIRAASVRRLYRQMCRAAAANGYGRAEAETPYEYLATLDRAWPEGAAETRLLTNAYVRVRYGEVPETQEELEALRTAWRRLEAQRPAELSVRTAR